MSEGADAKALSAIVLFEMLLRRLEARGVLNETDRRAILDDAVEFLQEVETLRPGDPSAEYVRRFFCVPEKSISRAPRAANNR